MTFGLTTDRLTLRPMDGPTCLAIAKGLRRHEWADGYPTAGDRETATLLMLAGAEVPFGDPWGPWQIVHRDSGLAIGGIGFKGPPDTLGAVEIGYGLVEQFRRQGLATEAVGALTEFAFGRQVRCVVARTHPDNIASARVLVKSGFHLNGGSDQELQWLRPDGRCTDSPDNVVDRGSPRP